MNTLGHPFPFEIHVFVTGLSGESLPYTEATNRDGKKTTTKKKTPLKL